ncbi:cocaine esterase-like [Morone saxatilis]|uniref:cocaine esterase-like n=1 Tax=Morone saxatilis TaxID=34816 RepID=UPI0015E2531F|nr:cocaine esterase-like [Morone saxatilis]
MKFRAKQTSVFLASVLFLLVAAELHAPEVHTKLGSLRGEYVSVKGKETGVHAYLGVPFAKPPVGPALRLAAPQPVEGWEGVRDATKQPLMCVQHKQFTIDLLDKLGDMLVEIPDISEDCLYLNIYTPANRAPNAKLPVRKVMVWIMGEGFFGSVIYDGSALAAYQDVVVVLIQYRLGLLGFLSTADEHMPGNFGLLDQVQALRWTKEHIHNFGGDPDLVTIFGESAGGMSVSLLLLSPLSDGLFHHAIAESGTAAMDRGEFCKPNFVGSDHGDELFTVFGFCFTTSHVTITSACPEEEEQLSKVVMSYWGNFAHTGSPNGNGLVHWPKYGAEEYYLEIGTKEQAVGQHLKKDRFVFMTQTLPQKVQQYKKEHSEL